MGSTASTWHGPLSVVHLGYDSSPKCSAGKKARRQEGTLDLLSNCFVPPYHRFTLLFTARRPLPDPLIVVKYLTTGNCGYKHWFLPHMGISTIVLVVLIPIEQISYHRPPKHRLIPTSRIPLFSIQSLPKAVVLAHCVSGAD
jgi:hypothetical protein